MTKKPFHRNIKENPDNWIYGYHAACAALQNPKRVIKRVLMTKSVQQTLASQLNLKNFPVDLASGAEIEQLVGVGAVHQGIAVLADSLESLDPQDILDSRQANQVIVLLDQITDPQNVGAILRSAAAFGAGAVVTTERNSAHMGGVLAKAASGALEQVPLIQVTNLVRFMEELQAAGFWCAGLAEEGRSVLDTKDFSGKWAVVMGAEGSGLRRLVKETCDYLVRLPTVSSFTTLNVSNAAAVVLYEIFRNQKEEKQ